MNSTSTALAAAVVAGSCIASTASAAALSRAEGSHFDRSRIASPLNRSSFAAAADDAGVVIYQVVPMAANDGHVVEGERATTAREHAIAELRRYKSLPRDWDGDGAAAPNQSSLRDAIAFTCAMSADQRSPEPQIHASGRAGLYWKDEGFYADIEFLGAGKIAYYIERGAEKHKGVATFNGDNLPGVFEVLLAAEEPAAAAAAV